MLIKVILLIQILLNLIIYFNINKIAKILNVFDKPDGFRKIHKASTPLLGGPIFLLSFLILSLSLFLNDQSFLELLLISKKEFLFLLILLIYVFSIGYFDDKYNLSANKKLILIGIFLYFYLKIDPSLVIHKLNFSFLDFFLNLNQYSVPFTITCFLLFINAFNMFDGIDLQCGIYSLFLIIVLLLFSLYTVLILYLGIQIIFFIILNYKKKTFLGDSGSLFLSGILSFLIIKSYNAGRFNFSDDIFLLMIIPGIDLLRLALSRSINKKHPFKADNQHIHHYLMLRFSFAKTTMIIQSLIILPALVGIFFKISFFAVAFSLIIYFFIIIKFRSKIS
jgi:UDP-GlcNAc:undecaprenyl-phosphate GlcNAc-1-phosphate transferase